MNWQKKHFLSFQLGNVLITFKTLSQQVFKNKRVINLFFILRLQSRSEVKIVLKSRTDKKFNIYFHCFPLISGNVNLYFKLIYQLRMLFFVNSTCKKMYDQHFLNAFFYSFQFTELIDSYKKEKKIISTSVFCFELV